MRLGLALVLTASLLAGCDPSTPPGEDGGTDAGANPQADAGHDGGQDAGEVDPGADAGPGDGGSTDGGQDAGSEDLTPPEVTSTSPASGGLGVSRDAVLSVVFSEPMAEGTLSAANLVIDGVSASVSYEPSTRTATLTPGSRLPNAALLTARVKTAVTDLAGNPLQAEHAWTFTTLDEGAPQVSATSPADGATGVAPTSAITVTFSRAMSAATLTSSTLQVDGFTSTVAYDDSSYVATLTPSAPLPEATTVTVRVTTGVEDALGNPLAAEHVFSFTTGDATAPIVSSTSPADGAAEVSRDAVLSVVFSEPMAAGTVTATQLTVDGLNAAVSYEPSTRTATLTPSARLPNGALITARVGTGVTDLAGNPLAAEQVWTFTTVAESGPQVSATSPAAGATGVSPGTSVTVSFSKPMDASTLNGTNLRLEGIASTVSYDSGTHVATLTPSAPLPQSTLITARVTTGVRDSDGIALAADYVFSFTTADTVAPTVQSTSPASGATGVSRNATVSIVFSEAMDPATLTGTQLLLEGIASTVSYDGPTRTATLTPSAPLPNAATVTARVKTGVTDLAGNPLGSEYVLSFTTADSVPPTVFSQSPNNGDTGVSTTGSISLYFSEAMAETTVNSGNVFIEGHGFTLTYFPGANLVRLYPSPALPSNTLITVRATTGVTDLAGNPLQADHVLSFTTVDTSPPTVVSTSPASFASGISRDATVRFVFNKPMNASSINATNLAIDGVTSSVSYDPGTWTATLTPGSRLPNGGQVTARVRTGVEDSLGNNLLNEYVLYFYTEYEAPPAVAELSPRWGATGVWVNDPVILTFNKPLDPTTVNETTFSLDGFASTVSYAPATQEVTLTPTAPLPMDALVSGRVTTGVRDTLGNALASEYTFHFTTAPTSAPVVVDVRPNLSSVNVSRTDPIVVTFNEPMDPTSLTAANLYMDSVVADVTYDPQTRQALLTPVAEMPNDTLLSAHVTTGVLDAEGNALAAPYDWQFRTKDSGPPHVVSTTPTDGATEISRIAQVTIEFNEPLDGSTVVRDNFVCGVPVYVYWQGGSSVIVAASSFNGWPNQATVNCTVTGNVRDLDGLAVDPPYAFSFTTVDSVGPQVTSTDPANNATNVPITAQVHVTFNEDMDETSLAGNFYLIGRTGTVTYDAPTRTATWTDDAPFANLTRYYARVTQFVRDVNGNISGSIRNWSFTTEPDTTAPTVVATEPADGDPAALQAPGAIRATFSEPMNAATVDATRFTCEQTLGGNTTPVTGTVSYRPSTRQASLIPESGLTYLAVYSCTLGTGLADLVGNTLATPYTFSFTVEADTYPPDVASSSPEPYGHFFAVTSPLTVTFDEPVDPATVNATNLQLAGVAATVSYDPGTWTATLTPLAALEPSAGYTLTVNGVADLDGRAMTTPWFAEFRTTHTPVQVSGITRPAYSELGVYELDTGTVYLSAASNGVVGARLQWAFLSSGGAWTHGELGTLYPSPYRPLRAATFGGRLGVVWTDVDDVVQFRFFDGSSWQSATNAYPGVPDDLHSLAGSSTTLAATWPILNGGVGAAFFDGTSWSAAAEVQPSPQRPVGVVHDGSAFVFLTRRVNSNNWYVSSRTFDGTTWGSTQQALTVPYSTQTLPRVVTAVAAHPNGGTAVFFSDRYESRLAVRQGGVWSNSTTGFTGQPRFDYPAIASDGSGFAFTYTVGPSTSTVRDAHVKVFDGATGTWGGVTYLARGPNLRLVHDGTTYTVAMNTETEVRAFRRDPATGDWIDSVVATYALEQSPQVTALAATATGRLALAWTAAGQAHAALHATTWQTPARLEGSALSAQPLLSARGDALSAFYVDDLQLQRRSAPAAATSFDPAATIPSVGDNGPSSSPTLALAADGRGLAVWEQYQGNQRAIFARPFDGTAWGAILQVTPNGQLPRVATNGTRWVISYVEPGTPARAFAASWTEAGGVTVPQQLSTAGSPAVVQDTGVASAAGSFYATWDEGAPIKARFSADGLTWDPIATLDNNSCCNGTPKVVAFAGNYAVSWSYSSFTYVAVRGDLTNRLDGACTLVGGATDFGGVCRYFSGNHYGVVGNTVTLLESISGASGPMLAAAPTGGRFRLAYSARTREYTAADGWSGALALAPEAFPLSLASDGPRVFGLVAGAGGGLDLLTEDPGTGFLNGGAFDTSTELATTPELFSGQGEVGALWLRPAAGGEQVVWGSVF